MQKVFNLDVFTNEDNVKHNLKCLYIPDHPYRDHDKSPIVLP